MRAAAFYSGGGRDDGGRWERAGAPLREMEQDPETSPPHAIGRDVIAQIQSFVHSYFAFHNYQQE